LTRLPIRSPMSTKTSVRTSYRASALAAENARLCAEQPPAADALKPTLLRRCGFRARLRRSVGLQILQRTIHMNTTLASVCVAPVDECSRPESVSPSPPHACPWDQGCY